MLFRTNFLVGVLSVEHVYKYESASYYHHTTQVFTLKQKPILLSGDGDGGERKCRSRGVQYEWRKKGEKDGG